MIQLVPVLVSMIAGRVMDALVRDPEVPVTARNEALTAPVVREAVTEVVTREVAPVILHATNNEPWYQSRVTLGALASILSGLLGLVGWTVGQEDLIPVLAAVGPILGGVLALVGRWRSRKPLGTG